ncbi:MAG: hypothetical protein SPG06_01970 [Eubacteriales bacterium]|nr:hypothetical protein [Eubacteriales bacterium]
MGGRGTLAIGKSVAYTYETVDKIEGVKVLEKKTSRIVKIFQKKHTEVMLIFC